MISTALKLMLLCVLMEQVTSWPPSREPESVYYAPGRRGHRPFQCCRACGDDYALTVDRCMYDPYHNKSKIYDPSDNTIFPNKLSSFHGEKFDVFMEVSRSCCAFCGTNKKEFEYSAEKGECVRLKEQVSTFITVHEQYCNLCLFITGDTLINNNHETILPYDLKKCNSFYSDKELCIIFLQNYYDEIIKNGLSSTPSKLCHQFGYCQSKGADYTGLLQEALAKLRSGEAKVIQNASYITVNQERMPILFKPKLVFYYENEQDLTVFLEDNRPICPFQWGGHTIPAIMDSGAQISVMRHSLAQKLNVPMEHTKVKLQDAQGNGLKIVGQTKLRITINTKGYDVKFIVAASLETSVLLGMPFLKNFSAIRIMHDGKKFNFKNASSSKKVLAIRR